MRLKPTDVPWQKIFLATARLLASNVFISVTVVIIIITTHNNTLDILTTSSCLIQTSCNVKVVCACAGHCSWSTTTPIKYQLYLFVKHMQNRWIKKQRNKESSYPTEYKKCPVISENSHRYTRKEGWYDISPCQEI